MAAIVYLDVDDEITSAAARIRSADGRRVALVVPHGSRLATSRINFRLLAREATIRDRRLSIVAGDAATRSLAVSAGLPVFGSVADYERGVEAPPSGVAAAATEPEGGPDAGTDLEATQALALPGAVERPKQRIVVAPRSWSIRAINWRALPAFDRSMAPVVGGVAALALIALAVGAWLLLPSATIVVTAREEPIAPVHVTVRADPNAAAPDAAAGVVPAERLSFDLVAADTFNATDKRIDQAAASGEVTFTSTNTFIQVSVPRGTRVSTDSGIAFVTTRAIVIPRANFVTGPARRDAPIVAVQAGPGGNVEAGTITNEPRTLSALLVSVNNAEPTSGGKRDEFPRISQADVDAAVEQLTRQLGTDFDAILADPSRTPDGLTLYLETRNIAEPEPSVAPESLVGMEVETFDLELTSTGTVIAIDTTPVASIGETRIREAVAQGYRLVDSSVDIDIGEATVAGESVSFPVTAAASQVRILDAVALRERVKGRPLDEARAILEEFGTVELSVWPNWVSTIPTIDPRLDVRVRPDAPDESPGPGGTPAPTATATP